MNYALSPHDRRVLEEALEAKDFEAVRTLLAIDSVRRADNGFTPSERRRRDASPPYDRERDGG